MRCGLTFSISATRLTGISRSIKASAKASNNKVKPLPGRAQGTSTVFRRGNARHRTMEVTGVLKKAQMLPLPLYGIMHWTEVICGI